MKAKFKITGALSNGTVVSAEAEVNFHDLNDLRTARTQLLSTVEEKGLMVLGSDQQDSLETVLTHYPGASFQSISVQAHSFPDMATDDQRRYKYSLKEQPMGTRYEVRNGMLAKSGMYSTTE